MTLLLFAFLFTSCKILNSQEDDYIYERIYLSKIELKDTVKVGEKFEVKIYGNFPTPGWEFYKIEVQELQNEFKITPIARIRKNIIVPQVLVPCSTSVELVCKNFTDFLKISVIGRVDTLSKTIKVVSE